MAPQVLCTLHKDHASWNAMLDISIVKKSGVPSFELGAAVYEEQTPYLWYAAPQHC